MKKKKKRGKKGTARVNLNPNIKISAIILEYASDFIKW